MGKTGKAARTVVEAIRNGNGDVTGSRVTGGTQTKPSRSAGSGSVVAEISIEIDVEAFVLDLPRTWTVIGSHGLSRSARLVLIAGPARARLRRRIGAHLAYRDRGWDWEPDQLAMLRQKRAIAEAIRLLVRLEAALAGEKLPRCRRHDGREVRVYAEVHGWQRQEVSP